MDEPWLFVFFLVEINKDFFEHPPFLRQATLE